jgi:type VI secretion system protein ImpK
MAAEIPESGPARPMRARWRDWLRVGALAVALLVVSEAIWLWQTWPVRELLQPEPIPGSSLRP